MSPLARSIYKTLAFFDVQDFPLTLLELSSYLFVNSTIDPDQISLSDLEETITKELGTIVEKKACFYFLARRENLVVIRNDKYRFSLKNFRKARKYLSWLKFFPYLSGVAISGSEALLNSTEKSDIDLFLVTRKNRIWLTRFLVSLYFQLTGQRRYAYHIRGRFCLNHYISQNQILYEDRNLYTAVEYASLIPVLGAAEFQGFWGRNSWLQNFIIDPLLETTNSFFKFERNFIAAALEILLEFSQIGPFLNWVSGKYQKKRIKMLEHILVSDEELSFHPGSRGQKVLAKFRENFSLLTKSK